MYDYIIMRFRIISIIFFYIIKKYNLLINQSFLHLQRYKNMYCIIHVHNYI